MLLFPGFGGPDRSFRQDVRRDIRPKTSSLGWFFDPEFREKVWNSALYRVITDQGHNPSDLARQHSCGVLPCLESFFFVSHLRAEGDKSVDFCDCECPVRAGTWKGRHANPDTLAFFFMKTHRDAVYQCLKKPLTFYRHASVFKTRVSTCACPFLKRAFSPI